MGHELLLNELWQSSLARLGGEAVIATSARELGAFQRARAVGCATDLLRLILAYCLGGMGLRTTSAWASSVGLAELSSVALLKRLRKCRAWMEYLVSALLGAAVQPASKGRRIRLLDGTSVPKVGREAKNNNGLWRLHCAFDLPAERFSFIELTDEKGGERLDRVSLPEAASLPGRWIRSGRDACRRSLDWSQATPPIKDWTGPFLFKHHPAAAQH